MARYRMTPARRSALRKAQLASARKRKGRGKVSAAGVARRRTTKAQAIKRRKVIKGVAVGAAVGVAAYQANYHARYVTGYHRTSYANASNIKRQKSFVSLTAQSGVEGSPTGIWFSRYRRSSFGMYKPLGATNQNFGPAVLKVKRIPRKAIKTHRQVMKNHGVGYDRGVSDWFMVDSAVLRGKKIKQKANPMTARYRRYKRNKLEGTVAFMPHMSYLVDNWSDPPKRSRTRRRRRK